MTTILERKDQDFLEIYNFIRDRGRAIRKDFKVQNHLNGPECVDCMERLSRFLIHSDFVLCEKPESVFSWRQNRHQIVDTLTTLNEIYDDELKRGVRYPNESEFRGYFILLNLEDAVAISRVQTWRQEIIHQPIVKTALAFYRAFQNQLYHRFFRLLRHTETTYLMACILQFSFAKVRKDGLRVMSAGFLSRDKAFPLPALAEVLGFDREQDALEFCLHWGFESVQETEPVPFVGIAVGKKDRGSWIGMVSVLISGVRRDASL